MTYHVVFIDSTLVGLQAFKSAKALGCTVTYIEPKDSSYVAMATQDASRVTPHLAYVDEHVVVANLEQSELNALLAGIHATRPIDALISTSEVAILQTARAAAHLGLQQPGYAAALARAVVKDHCRAALRDAGVRSPRFEVMSESQLLARGPQSITLPFVIKPTRGFGKQFSAVCHTTQDYQSFVSTLAAARTQADPMVNIVCNREYIVEQYIAGTLHSAEVIVRDGQVECFATTTRYRSHHNELLEMAYSMPAGLSPEKSANLQHYLQQVFSAVGLEFGLYHVELLYAEDGPYLVEINGRLMGGAGAQVYQTLSGIDILSQLVQLNLGQDFPVDQGAIKGAATVVLLGARDEGRVADTYTAQALAALLAKYDITYCTLNLQPGQAVRKYEGNLSVLGHAIVHGADQQSSALRGHAFLLELDALLGVPTAKYMSPDQANIRPLAA